MRVKLAMWTVVSSFRRFSHHLKMSPSIRHEGHQDGALEGGHAPNDDGRAELTVEMIPD